MGAMTPRRLAALAAVAQDRVTYRTSGPHLSYRVWASAEPAEREYVTATPAVTWLLREGLVQLQGGYRWGRGIVVATPAGLGHLNGRLWSFWSLLAGGWR